MRRWHAAVAGLALMAGLALVSLTLDGSGAETLRLSPNDPEEVALGPRVCAEACASCHIAGLEEPPNRRERGPDGTLPAPPHDESGHTWYHSDAMLFTLTRDGFGAILGEDASYTSGMPAFAGQLTDAEIFEALSYIKSTWPEEISARHDQINADAGEK